MSVNVGNILLATERLVVIAAAAIAVFPLWQWYTESEARRLDRITGFISAGSECRKFLDSHEVGVIKGWAEHPMGYDVESEVIYRLDMAALCAELLTRINRDIKPEIEYYEHNASNWVMSSGFDTALKEAINTQ